MNYIITDGNLIYSAADTVSAAWSEARDTLASARVQLIGDYADSDDCHGSWMRESDLSCMPASPALVADVNGMGGAIAWREVDGVAVTVSELNAA